MKINRIRIAGFKSFADTTDVPVLDGITGIVGPNGCGKSNVIESFRWAMGELNVKHLRGGSMDDVIFNGTDLRAPKSSCSVTLFAENPGHLGPPELKDLGDLEITRRLDRGDGTSYRANGRSVRTKDVAVLFKDAGLGSRSSALVSQGRVNALIAAKPAERRSILEEAAGVAGLASRKHEAELRLRGTEENLERAEMIEKGLNDQLTSLKRQARQARRRKEIDELVRAAEAAAYLVRRIAAEHRLDGATGQQTENEEAVKAAMIAQTALASALAAVEARAAPLLDVKIKAETAFALAKARVDTIRKEIAGVRTALANARRNAVRAEQDIERDRTELEALQEEVELLRDEILGSEDDAESDAVVIEENAALVEEARERLDEAAETAATASEGHSLLTAQRDALAKREADLSARVASLTARLTGARARIAEFEAALAALPDTSAATAEQREALEAAEEALVAASEARTEADIALRDAKTTVASVQSMRSALSKERASLAAREEAHASAASLSQADDGFDEPLSAALGAAFHAPLDAGDTHWWSKTAGDGPTHPRGTQALLDRVRVPAHLVPALSATGWTETDDEAEALTLSPGQSAVTRAGRLWRWDGYRSRGDAAAAQITRRQRRLAEIETELTELAARERDADLPRAQTAMDAASLTETAARATLAKARADLEAARRLIDTTEQKRADFGAKAAGAREASADAAAQIDAERQALSEARTETENHPSLTSSEAKLSAARAAQTAASRAFETARTALDKARREAETRSLRVNAVRKQIVEIEKRATAATATVAELEKRRAEANDEARQLEASELLDPEAEAFAIEDVEERLAALVEAQEAASSHETALSDARQSARDGEQRLAALKETRAGLLAEIRAAQEGYAALAREIDDRIKCPPAALEAVSGIADPADLPDLAACEQRVQRLTREREMIGVVNLLAEEQLGEFETRVDKASRDRAELREAVRKLRDTIATLNAECRERLLEAFTAIDRNFRSLFERVFQGGQAYLKLSGSEDPLEAGLEIFAQPPGKKLTTMSLLSGGEQALIALSLIFAAFLIRPAPICILDEVDAPFDDANVDRMCRLIRDLEKDGTRFLVITHHSLTMARCDRLYGVTMPERGVSRLMTVDIDQAVAYVTANSL